MKIKSGRGQLQPHKGFGGFFCRDQADLRLGEEGTEGVSLLQLPQCRKRKEKAPVGGVTMNNLDLLRGRLLRGWRRSRGAVEGEERGSERQKHSVTKRDQPLPTWYWSWQNGGGAEPALTCTLIVRHRNRRICYEIGVWPRLLGNQLGLRKMTSFIH